jgi:IclR helix-turn-helix domain
VNDRPQTDPSVSITLTTMQIARVVCDTDPRKRLLSVLLALMDPRYELRLTTLAASPTYNTPGVSRALLHGFLVLSTFNGRPEQTLTQIANRVEMSMSLVRNYLMTLIMLKIVSQEEAQRPYRLIGCDPESRYGLLPMLLAVTKPDREVWVVQKLQANRKTPRISLGFIRGIAVLSTFGARPTQRTVDVATRLEDHQSTISVYLQTLTAIGLLEYELKRYRLANI